MIDAAAALLRLLLGLGAIFGLGYAVLAVLAPQPQDFRGLERAALSFGLGILPLTLWMLALTWIKLPFGLGLILGPLLALAAALLLSPRGRGFFKRQTLGHDWRALKLRPLLLPGWDWVFLALLGVLFLFVTLRAVLYPMWAWDAIATWGCKARVFYLTRGLDLTCIDAHNYYPNLVPLLLSYLYFCLGQVNDHLVNIVFPLMGASLLTLLYSFSVRLGLRRRQALGLTTFLALNGTVFIVHLYIAYADLPLAFFTLAAAGLLFFWLADTAPRGSLSLCACFLGGMAWCKYEGPPLAASLILAAVLSLLWLRPPRWPGRLGQMLIPLAGLAAGYLPWRIYSWQQQLEIGADHVQGFYPQQFFAAIASLAAALTQPYYFGFLWPALLLALLLSGRRLKASPGLFLALFIGGNLLAIVLAYGVAPTSAAEFPRYVEATLDRLLLHIAPVAALLLAWGLNEGGLTPEGSGR
jgi:hypothetical protein